MPLKRFFILNQYKPLTTMTKDAIRFTNDSFWKVLETIKKQQLDLLRTILHENDNLISFRKEHEIYFAEYQEHLEIIKILDNEINFILADGSVLLEDCANISNNDLCLIITILETEILD